jgi:hypothetical protein
MSATKINPATLRAYLRAEEQAARAQVALERAQQRLIAAAVEVLGDDPDMIATTWIDRRDGHFIVGAMFGNGWTPGAYCLIAQDGEVRPVGVADDPEPPTTTPRLTAIEGGRR